MCYHNCCMVASLFLAVVSASEKSHRAYSQQPPAVNSASETNCRQSTSPAALQQLKATHLRQAWKRATEQCQTINKDDQLQGERRPLQRINHSFVQLCESLCEASLPAWWKNECLHKLAYQYPQSIVPAISTPRRGDGCPSVIMTEAHSVYRRLPGDVWIHSSARDIRGLPIQSVDMLREVLNASSKVQKSFNAFDQRTGVAVSSIRTPGQFVLAVHSPLSISIYPVVCTNDKGDVLWQTDVGAQLLSTASGDEILHQVEILATPHSYVLVGADALRVYLVELDRINGNSVAIFDSRCELISY